MIWTAKPPYGTQISRKQQLLPRLQSFWAAYEGGAGILHDAVGATGLSAVNFGSSNPWGSASQPGLICNTGENEGAAGIVPTVAQVPYPITIFGAGRFLSAISGSPWLVGLTANNTGTNPYGVAIIYISSGKISLVYNGDFILTGPTPSVGVDYVWSATLTTTSQNVYVNGLQVMFAGTSIASPDWSSTSQWILGTQGGSQTFQSNAIFYWGGYCNSALSAAQHFAAFNNPFAVYQMFQPTPTLAYHPVSLTSFLPWIYGDQCCENGC